MVRKLNRVGRCRFCQVENKRRYKAAKTAEYRKRKRAENAIVTTADKHCICGCGVKIDSVRKIYASNECRKKMKPPKVKKVAMPRDWAKKEPHRPLIEPKVVEESAYQIIVLAHVVVTKLPPCGVSRWTLPEEIDPAKERVHREMMRWNTQSF
ncbi:MAG: hypothetical protein EBR82_22565 [Caulobacteraceae bacterium]|nr:hypothetical protein [Caulobacteraceae bacterium]